MKKIVTYALINLGLIVLVVIFFHATYSENNINPTRNYANPFKVDSYGPKEIPGMKLVWHDEFNREGKPNTNNWGFEYGFVRNRELQWYQPQNASCKNGRLIIHGKKERVDNPNFYSQSGDWRDNREQAEYSSSCLLTKGINEWTSYGYFEIRARFDTSNGAWPAIWLMGSDKTWPSCGEIDLMEFYRINDTPNILANVAWGSQNEYHGTWNSTKKPLAEFIQTDPEWIKKYHIWSMKWDEKHIEIFLDDKLINRTRLNETINPDGDNPFGENKKHYLLLNLALGSNGGDPSESNFPITFEIDYVRIYKPI